MDGEIAAKFLAAVLAQPKVKRLLSSDHFSVDGTLIEAWASIKSFRRKDGGDEDPPGPGRNAERNFHKESAPTRRTRARPIGEARLYKKGDGQPAKLCYMGHALMENRHGLAVGGGISQPPARPSGETALALIDGRRRAAHRITLAADKAYDVTQFVHDLRDRSVTPHIAIDGISARPASGVRRRSTDAPPAMPATTSVSAAANASKRCSAGSRVPPVWPR